MYDVVPNTDPPSPETPLRRYMSVAKLVSLLGTSSLFFVPLRHFEDRFEGTFPKSMSSHDDLPVLKFLRDQARVCCWHEEDVESDALWRLYASKEETVAIRTDVKSLRDAVESVPEPVAISRVRYIDFDEWTETNEGGFYQYIYKRRCFAHEREVRAIVQPGMTFDLIRNFQAGVVQNPPPPVDGLAVPVERGNLVHEVIVSPYGGDWLLQAIRSLLKRMELSASVAFSRLR